MTLPVWSNTTPLSLGNIQAEFGGTGNISLSEYYAGGLYVTAGTTGSYQGVTTPIPSSGNISIGNFYGASAGGGGGGTTTTSTTTTSTTTAAPTPHIIAVGSPRSYHSYGYRGVVYTSTDYGATWYKSRTNSSGTFTSEAFPVNQYLDALVDGPTGTMNAFTQSASDRDGDSFADGIDRAMFKANIPPTDAPSNLDKTQWTNLNIPSFAVDYLDTVVESAKYNSGTNKVYGQLSNNRIFRINPDGSGYEEWPTAPGGSYDFAYSSDLSTWVAVTTFSDNEVAYSALITYVSESGWGGLWSGPFTSAELSGVNFGAVSYSVTYGAGKFVGVFGKRLVYSQNPIKQSPSASTWLFATLTDGSTSNYFRSVCFGQNKFVAVGSTREHGTGPNYPGSIYTSTDGITWSPAANRGHTITAVLRNVHYSASANIFIAVGDDGPNNVAGVIDIDTGLSLVNTNIVLTSPDGSTWTRRTLPNTQDSLSLIASTSYNIPTTTTTTTSSIGIAGICGKSYHLDIMNGTSPWSYIQSSGMLNVARDFNPVQNLVQAYAGWHATNVSQYRLDITAFNSNVSVPVVGTNTNYVVEYVGTFRTLPEDSGSFEFGHYQNGSVADDWFMMWIGPNALSGYTADNATFKSKTNESNNNTYLNLSPSTSYPFRAIYGNGAGARSLDLWLKPPGFEQVLNELGQPTGSVQLRPWTNEWYLWLRHTSCTLPAFNPSSIRFFGVATNAPISDGKGGFSTGNIINRFGFTSTAGVTRVIIKAKLDSSLTSTTGVTYNSMGGTEQTTFDSSNVPEIYSDGKGGDSYTGLIYSPSYILRLLVQNAWDHRAVPLSTGNLAGTVVGYHSQEGDFGPGQCVVGYRMFVYTNDSPYPTAGFTTSSSSVPVTDYIRLGGSAQQPTGDGGSG